MKKLGLYACLVLAFCVHDAWAQFDNVGTSAANFLKIGVGSRAEAMGGAYVAQVKDVTALYWNVAGLARLEKNEVMVSRTDWILDINHVFVGAAMPLGNFGTLGASVYSLTMGEMEQTTANQPDGTGVMFGASNFAVGLAFARSLTDRFSVGVHTKYVRESISSMAASSVAIDFGTQYVTSFHGLTIGMAISNFGPNMHLTGREQLVRVDIDPSLGGNPTQTPARLETESWPLPLSFRLGVSLDIMNNENYRLTGNIDYTDPRDINPVTSFGAEFAFNEMFYLRGGFRTTLSAAGVFANERLDAAESDANDSFFNSSAEESFFTAGGGLYLKYPGSGYALRLDYAYSDLGRLTRAHRFTFGFNF